MSHINFVIPQSKNELLTASSHRYYVRDLTLPKEIFSRLQEARQCYRDEGPEFILENFGIYFSLFHNADNNTNDNMYLGYQDLHKAVVDLNKNIGFVLEDKDSLNDELKLKYLNILKMLLYVYINLVMTIDQKHETKRNVLQIKVRGSKKKTVDVNEKSVDKKGVVLAIINILDRDINLLWDPPVVDEFFVNMVSNLFYWMLEVPSIKSDSELRSDVFTALGILLKQYNHGRVFTVRIVQLIKLNEHLVHCVPEGIKLLVNNFNTKGVVRDFIREITEWQTDEKIQDSEGTKYCAGVLSEMANLMPDLMIPELMYLSTYLAHDSYTLRNSVLNVITEVLLNVLSKDNLTEEQKESRDELLEIIQEHILDQSAHVRSKVLQQWARLQKENAIPIKTQASVLEKVVGRLYDKAALVRKNAVNCVTTFLTHNIYGAQLQLNVLEKELKQKEKEIANIKSALDTSNAKRIKEVDAEWKARETELRDVITRKLNEASRDQDVQIPLEELPGLIRLYLLENKFEDVFTMCCTVGKQLQEWKEITEKMKDQEEAELFLMLLKTIFYSQEICDAEALSELERLQRSEEYLTDAITFLHLIDKAIEPMKELLESVSIGDMQEAVGFFTAAYQFNIDRSLEGISDMLKVMQTSEQDRQEFVVNAFKTIYLTTDAKNLEEHKMIIIRRLINLLKMMSYDNLPNLHLIVSEWVSKGVLDNSIIDGLWQCFTKQVETSDDDSRAAVYLLTMAAKGRKTIITKNIKMVATVAFTERGKEDLLLFTAACELLAIAGNEKQNITDKNPPLRIKIDDQIWKDLISILEATFFKNDQFYNLAISSAINLIYKLCSRPDKLCEGFIKRIVNGVVKKYSEKKTVPCFVLTQCVHLFGEIAIKQLGFLDETVYKELKRRNYIREERKDRKKKNSKNVGNQMTVNVSATSRRSSAQQISINEASTMVEESTLEGAQAEDPEAEFILNALENAVVTRSGGLEKFAHLIVLICQQPNIYDSQILQSTATLTLLRYMLLSSVFCERHIQLVFTILEKTPYTNIKITILIHLSDLLEKFPNIIDPWTPRMFDRLQDTDSDVRCSTLFILSNMILKDMIRVQAHLSKMAKCLVDAHDEVREMSRSFFTLQSYKANTLYCVLPDIFSHLCEDTELGEENLRLIMDFLFGLIDKNKQMESLVERFCLKFSQTEDDYTSRNIAYCLSLIQYTDKGLQKLIDNFPVYKHRLMNNDVYTVFKQITNTYGKNGKNEALVTELENQINSVFNIDGKEDGEMDVLVTNQKRSGNSAKTPFKMPKRRAPRKKSKKSQDDEDDEESMVIEENKENESVRRSSRTKRTRAQIQKIVDSDSD